MKGSGTALQQGRRGREGAAIRYAKQRSSQESAKENEQVVAGDGWKAVVGGAFWNEFAPRRNARVTDTHEQAETLLLYLVHAIVGTWVHNSLAGTWRS